MNRIQVCLHENSYDVIIGCNLLQELDKHVQELQLDSNVFFVLDENIKSTHGEVAMCSFGNNLKYCSLTALEKYKTMPAVERIWSTLLEQGFDRNSCLVSIGGGLTGDIGGFAAATFLRGISLIQVPTTLLAMVDASIGGKTGVNLPVMREDGTEILGKNLAGAFWQPKLVVADISTLSTLDDRQFRCGLAECVKHAMLGHDDLLASIKNNYEEIIARDEKELISLVAKSVGIKADIVAKDERETGCRALLNLGHTFAHAIEPMTELGLFHGEAVSIGLCAACSCSEAIGMVDADYVDEIRGLLTKLGLPTRLPMPIQIDDAMHLMQKDKKTIDAQLRLVLPSNDGASVVEGVDNGAITLAWTSIGGM
jgi:3-dehydroquinate synthase